MDTAEVYAIPATAETYGKTESYIGTWFKKTGKRDKWILATKIAGRGRPWIRGGAPVSKQAIAEAVDGSLRRLQTDYIDLYQIHWPNRGHYHFMNSWTFDPTTQETTETLAQIEETLDTLNGMITAGKIRHVGVSNETPWGTMRYIAAAERAGLPRIVSIQNPYNLLNRSFEVGLAEIAHREQAGLLASSPMAFGVLSGKYLEGRRPAGARLTLFDRFVRYSNEQGLAATAAYREHLIAEGIETTHITATPDTATGSAFITVDDSGENTIVVHPGANHALTPEMIDDAAPAFADADHRVVRLLYTGSIHRHGQDVSGLFEAIALLGRRGLHRDANHVDANR